MAARESERGKKDITNWQGSNRVFASVAHSFSPSGSVAVGKCVHLIIWRGGDERKRERDWGSVHVRDPAGLCDEKGQMRAPLGCRGKFE